MTPVGSKVALKDFRQIKSSLCLVLSVTALVGFLAGYGFEKFIRANTRHANMRSFLRRDVSSVTQQTGEKRNFESSDRSAADIAHDYDMFHQEAITNVNTSYITQMLRYFTKQPHLGGTKASAEQAHFVRDSWSSYGFDKVEEKRYDVLLSYPTAPAEVSVVDGNGSVVFQATMTEDAFFKEENSSESVYPFNAYAASGNVEAEYIYVNFGEPRDYAWLMSQNVSLEGKIFVARYGLSFRGEKARLAQEYKAAGMILYGDPKDYASDNTSYPDSWGLPPNAIPRGNIVNVKGDPLTPGYPSVDGAFRLNESDVKHLARIPVTPISYQDAHSILSLLDGLEVPDSYWQGGMNFTYRATSTNARKIRLVVNTKLEIRPIYNVVGTIRGAVEPDRILLLGNHRDAWVFGAADPSSGTACLMETARVLAKLLTSGWRPRRTIMLISWDAEEYGLMGSVEWVEEYASLLRARAVAYLNVDIAVEGNHSVRAKSSPIMIDKFFNVTKSYQDPDSALNLYTSWQNKTPQNEYEPSYSMLGSGSDFTAFYSGIGVSCIDFRYTFNKEYHKGLPNYPTYHTIYDNYNWMHRFVDPDMRYHTIVTKLWVQLTLEMADELLLPYNLTRYAEKIAYDTEVFEMNFNEIFKPTGISFETVRNATEELKVVAAEFHKRLDAAPLDNCNVVRGFNDQMMSFERAFIVPEGMPGRPDQKHVIYSPTRKQFFANKVFPSLAEALFDIEFHEMDKWNIIREQISVIANTVRQASMTLKDYGTA